MSNEQKLVALIRQKKIVKTSDIIEHFKVSRQYAARLMKRLVDSGKLFKTGSTRSAAYVLADPKKMFGGSFGKYARKLKNVGLEEHKVLSDIEQNFTAFNKLPENIKSIFIYAFSEMLNNAIEHSGSKTIEIEVFLEKEVLSFTVGDFGVGVYRNIMEKRHLTSELEAIQDLLKGKTTTAPALHSGEGIFFTSKVGDNFLLDSFGYQFMTDNTIPDIFMGESRGWKKGTKITFSISLNNKGHLNDVFRKFTSDRTDGEHGFNKTEISVRLFVMGGVHISRSQARRILAGLDKFKVIKMDYDRVPMIGQAFADEVYRVFNTKYPAIRIEDVNTNEAVKFMIDRARAAVVRA